LKSELAACAKQLGLRATGGKFAILDRIAHCLDTGETSWPGDQFNQYRRDFVAENPHLGMTEVRTF
jgi:hypothetical protein